MYATSSRSLVIPRSFLSCASFASAAALAFTDLKAENVPVAPNRSNAPTRRQIARTDLNAYDNYSAQIRVYLDQECSIRLTP